MRDPETARLLDDVRRAVAAARAGGVTARACLFDATTAAVDQSAAAWPSVHARQVAESACRALDRSPVRANPAPRPRPPLLARLLLRLAEQLTTGRS
ncbi:hypothetical protein [Streptomyces sp. SAI-127]|uniref:hypothetical protein n=1 Tax=Streptomyces sp. SAI-127 TaxID=2940543 RepID=UPI0024745512|nr:hypothetical protein [Streptomyces sp. SAI-127]MDH6489606.1 hypothetical protein [Streptomyces sp. SAI-127]